MTVDVRAADSPSRYVSRVDVATGRELGGTIRPEELLVHAHRDRSAADLALQYVANRAVALTGSEWLVSRIEEGLAGLAHRVAGGRSRPAFRFRHAGPTSKEGVRALVERLQEEARRALVARGRNPRLRLLLTGATGFLGQEIVAQAAADPHVAEVVCLVRRKRRRPEDGSGRAPLASGRQRGRELLRLLGIAGAPARKFRFVEGDVEKWMFGLSAAERRRLERTLTHVVHGAASVSFDESYESSFRANVRGTRHALELSLRLQRAAGSPFVAYLAVETSYVHGRAAPGVRVAEGPPEFPPHYYNNYYELTKAMAALDTDRAMFEDGLRVVQLLPSIVTGHSRTGNNRGDSKVVNAPINAFGRIGQALHSSGARWQDWPRTLVLRAAATAFPADVSAELNLVPVDRVAAGVLAALEAPQAVGTRIHLATDRRIRSADMVRVMREEIGVGLRVADPTLTRRVILPVAGFVLARLGQQRLARSLARLAAVFGVYSEWGQPVHGVGNDVRVLELPAERPPSLHGFRMACRHNRYVLEFGHVKDPAEIARREQVWAEVLDEIELDRGRPGAEIPPAEFDEALRVRLDLTRFLPRRRRGRAREAAGKGGWAA